MATSEMQVLLVMNVAPFIAQIDKAKAALEAFQVALAEIDPNVIEVEDETPPDVDTSPEPENDTVSDPIDPEDPKT